MLNAKENLLAAISFGRPEYVPMACEDLWHGFQFEGNFRMADWTDAWGIGWTVGIEGTVPFATRHPLPSLDRLDDWRVPDPDRLVLTAEMKSALAAVDRGEKLVHGSLTHLLFERAWALMGMENFLTALITHPAEAHELLHGIAGYARRVFDRYLELDVDAVTFSEDLGTQRALMISPAMFREFFLPQYEYIFEPVLAAGKLVYFHSCGCIDAVAGQLASIGVSILNPIQARANDLAKVKADTTGRMALDGGIDTAVLVRGTPDDVRAEVRRVMGILKPGGGWICGPDQTIPGIPEANFEALWDSVREVGRY